MEKSKRLDVSGANIPSEYNAVDEGSLLMTGIIPGRKGFSFYNGTDKALALCVSVDATATEPSVGANLPELYVEPTSGLILDKLPMQKTLWARTTDGAPATTGFISFMIWNQG